MDGVSFGAVIDYLVTGLPAVVEPVVFATDPPADGIEVADNWPVTQTDTYVIVGREAAETADAATGTHGYYALGAQRVEEVYTVPCFVEATRWGPAQKPARDAVIGVFDAIVAFVHADPTLGGLIGGGRIAEIQSVQLHQTQDAADAGDSGDLRRAVIVFEFAVKNVYTP